MTVNSFTIPTWIIQGGAVMVLSFLALFQAGALPFLGSPNDKVYAALKEHDSKADMTNRILRSICYRLPPPPRGDAPCE